MLSEEAAAQRTGAVTGLNYREAKSPVMEAVEEAEEALDLACAAGQAVGGAGEGSGSGSGEGGSDDSSGGSGSGGFLTGAALVERVAGAYERAGLADAANFIRAAA